MPMLPENTVLKRLPPNLDQTQMLFLDGIRHSAEIADLAMDRLRRTLTEIAISYRETSKADPNLMSAAFLDAWAFVDAIDRLRSLLWYAPGIDLTSRSDDHQDYFRETQIMRDLRNVTDHLATRVPHIIAHRGAALGILSWVTVLDPEAGRVLTCVITPGTIRSGNADVVNPLGHQVLLPTDLIHLAAGEHRGCLSHAAAKTELILQGLEDSLTKFLETQGVLGKQAGADLLVVLELTPRESPGGDPVEAGIQEPV